MRRLTLLVVLMVCVFGLLLSFSPQSASAQSERKSQCTNNSKSAIEIVPTWHKYLEKRWDDTHGCQLDDNITEGDEFNFDRAVPKVLLAVFEILIRLAGFLAVIFVIYGGFQYLTSTGEPDKAKAARTTIINALVGMMIAMFATVIVNVIGRNLG